MTTRDNVYYQQLQQFDEKQNPSPASDNVQIQKVSAPTDSATVSDGNAITFYVSARPFLYSQARYAASQYGG